MVRKCNVKLNTSRGQRKGRCGPSFHHTVCSSGYCSNWGWCGYTWLHRRNRWHKKYDRSAANRACFRRITKRKVKRTIRTVVKGTHATLRLARLRWLKAKKGKNASLTKRYRLAYLRVLKWWRSRAAKLKARAKRFTKRVTRSRVYRKYKWVKTKYYTIWYRKY